MQHPDEMTLRARAEDGKQIPPWQRAALFRELAQLQVTAGQEDEGRNTLLDASLFSVPIFNRSPFEQRPRYDKDTVTRYSLADVANLDYFANRLAAISAPECRVNYADFLAAHGRVKVGAGVALTDLRTLATKYANDAPYSVDCLGRALELALQTRRIKDADGIASALLSVGQRLTGRGDSRWAIEAATMLLLDRNRRTDPAVSAAMITMLDGIFSSMTGEPFEYEFCARVLSAFHLRNGDHTAADAVDDKVVGALQRAAQQQTSHMRRAHFGMMALDRLDSLGVKDRSRRASNIKDIEDETRLAISGGEFGVVEARVKVDVQPLRQQLWVDTAQG